MAVYTPEQRQEILRHYFENHGNIAECVRKLRTAFGRRGVLSDLYFRYLVKKSERYWHPHCKKSPWSSR